MHTSGQRAVSSKDYQSRLPEPGSAQAREEPVNDVPDVGSGQVDEFGFYNAAAGPVKAGENLTLSQYRSLESKWLSLTGSSANVDGLALRKGRSNRKLKRLCRRGIPDSLRAKVWPWLTCSDLLRQEGLFAKISARPEDGGEIYDVIDRDIERSYPDNIYFKTPSSGGTAPPALDDLRKVLYAYAQYRPELGYTQGMGRLVGCLLLQMPAESAFWTLARLVESDWYMSGYYTPDLKGLKINAAIFTILLRSHEPRISRHLERHEIDPVLYLAPWHMSLFTSTLPWKTVLRLWDAFLLDGSKLILRISLAILGLIKDQLLRADQEETYRLLLHPPIQILSVESLFDRAFRLKIKRSTLRKLRESLV